MDDKLYKRISKKLDDVDDCIPIFKRFGLDTSDEIIDHLKSEIVKKEMTKAIKNEVRLKTNNKLPRIYLNKNICSQLLEEFTNTKRFNKIPLDNVPNEGYVLFSIQDFIEVIMPETNDELLYVIQHHTGTGILDKFNNVRNRIVNRWNNVLIHYVIKDGVFSNIEIYDNDLDLCSNLEDHYYDALKQEASSVTDKVTYKMMFENIEDERCSYGVEDDQSKENFDKIVSICIAIFHSAMKLLGKSGNEYIVTKENINAKIKKDSNYKIDLNREIKQRIKKDNILAYYIEK